MTTKLLPIVRIASFVLATAGAAANLPAQEWAYRERADGRERTVVAAASPLADGGLAVEVDGSSGKHRVELGPDGGTRSWQASYPDGRTVGARLAGAAVELTTPRGQRRLALGKLPWFQAPDWQIVPLARSPAGSRVDFATVDPDTAEFREFSAANQGAETIRLEGTSRQAVKVEVTVRGLPGFFWKSTYWYDAASFGMLRFEGRRGGPGSPLIIMEALSPAGR